MQERTSPNLDTEQVLLLVEPGTLEIVHASHGACRVLGVNSDPLGEMSLREILLHPPPGELDRLLGSACSKDGVDATVNALLAIAGGRTAPVELTLMPLASGGRALIAVTLESSGVRTSASDTVKLDGDNAVFADFAGRLGHDLNNLLSTIIGSLGLLREDDAAQDASERHQIVDDALSASRECADLLDRLLAAAGKQILRPQRMDVNDVIQRIAPLLKSTLPENIELEVSLEPGLPEVQLDPDRLEAAIICLVVNAREAMSTGGGLSISSGVDHDSDPPEVRISVLDRGPGIPEHLRAKVLEPLFTTKPGGTGRGLGLNIVNGFVQQSNGIMNIECTEGQSTRVTLSFPAAS